MCCIHQDEKEYVLMNLLLLFSPDQLELIQRSRVEQIQLHFAMLLHNYLYFRLDPAPQLPLLQVISSSTLPCCSTTTSTSG